MRAAAAVLICAGSAAIAAIATNLLLPVLRRRIVDIPNERSSHTVATPRGGGLGILAGASAGIAAAGICGWPVPAMAFLLAVGIVALIGLLDDRFGGLPVGLRLAAQVSAAGLLVWQLGPIEAIGAPGLFSVPLGRTAAFVTLLWIVTVVNIYNFLDGIDGFAGAQGVVAGAGLAGAFWGSPICAVGLAVAGACAGFLRYNWHRARIFMGDVGSTALGMAFAASPLLLGAGRRADGVFAVTLALWLFLSDGVFTLLRRLLRGERIWQAHRSHLYQRLVATGLRHDQVVIAAMGPAVVLAFGCASGIRLHSPELIGASAFAAALVFGAYWVWTVIREAGSLQVKRLRMRGVQVDTPPAKRVN